MGKILNPIFLKNWENCTQMWVTWQRDEFSHFGNTTNNRVESSHQKIERCGTPVIIACRHVQKFDVVHSNCTI